MTNFKSSNGVLTINLNALADNYRLFQEHVNQGCAIAGVVKANAYGLGRKEVTTKLKDIKCPQFFVATLDEAFSIRSYDTQTPIAVLNGLMQGMEKEYVAHNITPVLNTPNDIERWSNLATNTDSKLPAIIHFDTGMNRLGLGSTETKKLVEDLSILKPINVQAIMSHFSCADEKDHPLTTKQAKLFKQIAQHFPKSKKSLSNSPGLFRDNAYHYDIIRPGYSLYGGNPTPETNNPMNNVVSLNAAILQIRECEKGESIGYGATHSFSEKTRTATVALGYADGFLRSGSSKAVLYYNNQPCPVLGRVSMDLTSIDISHIKGKQPKQGEAIEILGPNQDIDDLAETAGTIGYEVLTALGARYKREYI